MLSILNRSHTYPKTKRGSEGTIKREKEVEAEGRERDRDRKQDK